MLALLVLCPLLAPAPAPAQDSQTIEFAWSAEARVFGVNALLGGASAGVAALIRGDPVVPALATGLGGGTLVYAGKRLAVDSLPMAGLLGRQLASVGGSIIGNVVAGRKALDRVALGAGPVRAYVGHGVDGVDWRLDVVATGATAWGLVRGAEFDMMKSISSGAVVLLDREGGDHALPGTIFHDPGSSRERRAYVLAHERVHILQYDQSFLSWGSPLEDRVGRRFTSLAGLFDRLEFNVPLLTSALLLSVFVWEQHHEQPWEKEAMYLGRTR